MIIVIGAGIAGLSLGYELVKRGAKVTVLEASGVGSGASGVATSYLEPRLGATPMRVMEREALKRWAGYAAELEEISGVDVGFRREGQIRVSLEANVRRLEKDLKARAAEGGDFESLSPQEILAREPSLSPDLVAGAHFPDVRWVAGSRVCEALASAIRTCGGLVEEGQTVTGILTDGNKVSALTKDNLLVEGDRLVLCNGIGANRIDNVPSDIPICRVVRGVNLELDMSSLAQPIAHLIKHHRGNLCPRSNDDANKTLIVGTTYEPDEESLQPDATVIEKLYANAEPILPLIRQLPLLAVRAGLRVKVGDGNLRLGQSAEQQNMYYSLSHAGAGFLRAPVIAPELAELILEGREGPMTRSMTSG